MTKFSIEHVSPEIARLYSKTEAWIKEHDIDTSDPQEVRDAAQTVVYSDGSIEDLLRVANDPYPDAGDEFVSHDHWPKPMLWRTPSMDYEDASPIAQIEQNVVEELHRLFGVYEG